MKRAVILMLVTVVALGGILTAVPPAVEGQNGPVYPIYVDASATGANNGASWEDAFVSLQDAFDAVPNIGVEIWVARGTYYPDEGAAQQDGNRTSTFTLVGNFLGFPVYGGFAGGETAREQRDWAANPTVLSGEIQQDGNRANNAYHVVTGWDGATFDGFTVTGGYAGGPETWESRGGGMLMVGGDAGVTLANCTFYDNYAGNGGGIYNENSVPLLVDCTFEANEALTGAGMTNSDGGNAILTDCTFVGNWASHPGGGMYNEWSSPVLEGCTFVGNRVWYTDGGGGMSNYMSSPVLGNCTFEANQAPKGGGMRNVGNVTSPSLSGCTFRGNLAWGDADDAGGGGMFNGAGAAPVVNDCTFTGNFADSRGGAMHNHLSSPVVSGTAFEGNWAAEGGGMYNRCSTPSLGNCTFAYNTADMDGGGLYNNVGTDAAVGNCTFAYNTAVGDGGGLYNGDDSAAALVDCAFAGNSAGGCGAGIFGGEGSEATVTNCGFERNRAEDGGGLCVGHFGEATVTNCVFWGNRASHCGGGLYVDLVGDAWVTNCGFHANSAGPGEYDLGGAIYVAAEYAISMVTNCILWGDYPGEVYSEGVSMVSVTYCDVQGDWGNPAEHNIDLDPMWADRGAGDFHLLPGSPCIDAGDNAAPDIPDFDFEGDDRIIDGDDEAPATVDMGVDEAKPATAVVFYDGFEDETLDKWLQDGQNDWFNSGQWAKAGTRSAEVDGMAVDAALSLGETFDLEGAWDATLSFSWLIESGLDGGEYLALDLWDGGDWVEVARLEGNVDAENVWHDEVIAIAPQFFVSDFNLQFRGKMSLSLEDALIDEVMIIATVP